jgi:hypothetical protein
MLLRVCSLVEFNLCNQSNSYEMGEVISSGRWELQYNSVGFCDNPILDNNNMTLDGNACYLVANTSTTLSSIDFQGIDVVKSTEILINDLILNSTKSEYNISILSYRAISTSYQRLGGILTEKYPRKAIELYTKSLVYESTNVYSHAQRLLLYKKLNMKQEGLYALDEMEKCTPGHVMIDKLRVVFNHMK